MKTGTVKNLALAGAFAALAVSGVGCLGEPEAPSGPGVAAASTPATADEAPLARPLELDKKVVRPEDQLYQQVYVPPPVSAETLQRQAKHAELARRFLHGEGRGLSAAVREARLAALKEQVMNGGAQ